MSDRRSSKFLLLQKTMQIHEAHSHKRSLCIFLELLLNSDSLFFQLLKYMRCGLSLGKIATSYCLALAGRVSFDDLVLYQFAIHLSWKQVLFGGFLKTNKKPRHISMNKGYSPKRIPQDLFLMHAISTPPTCPSLLQERIWNQPERMIRSAEATGRRKRQKTGLWNSNSRKQLRKRRKTGRRHSPRQKGALTVSSVLQCHI